MKKPEIPDDVLNFFRKTGSVGGKERAKKYKEQAQEWADRGKDVIAQQKDNIRSAFEAGRQAYRDASQQDPIPDPDAPKV